MTAKTGPTTVRHQVGTCPACHCGIYAEFDVVVEVGKPTINRESKAMVSAQPYFVAGRLAHHCVRDEDGSWTTVRANLATSEGVER